MMLLKAKALAIGLMVAGGVAAPIATHYATQPADSPLPAKADLVPEIEVPITKAPAETPAPATVMTDLEVKPAPKPAVAAPVAATPTPALEPERRCVTRELQSVGSGAVLICDVERTSTGKSGGVFAPIEKPAQLTPRDLPSPSGFVR